MPILCCRRFREVFNAAAHLWRPRLSTPDVSVMVRRRECSGLAVDYKRARSGWRSAQALPRLRIGTAPRCSHRLVEPKGCSTAISRVGVPFGEFAVVGVTHTLRAKTINGRSAI
jgi:hypothetical protein